MYSKVPNKHAARFILFGDFFSTYIALLGTARLLISDKAITTFYIINIKNTTYMPILRPVRLLISEETSHLHGYLGPTLIRDFRVRVGFVDTRDYFMATV